MATYFSNIVQSILICCILNNLIVLAQNRGARQKAPYQHVQHKHYHIPDEKIDILELKNKSETHKYDIENYSEILNELIDSFNSTSTETNKNDDENDNEEKIEIRPCTCGVFLSNQIQKKKLIDENPVLVQEFEKIFPCTKLGIRQCQNECFQLMIKYLPKSAEILCASVNQDIHKLKAHLFVQNCDTEWHNSNLAAGREYCCKDGTPYNCPLF